LLGKYAGFHGTTQGMLRMDFGFSWKLRAQPAGLGSDRESPGQYDLLMSTAISYH
jgi:hypothetical protein